VLLVQRGRKLVVPVPLRGGTTGAFAVSLDVFADEETVDAVAVLANWNADAGNPPKVSESPALMA